MRMDSQRAQERRLPNCASHKIFHVVEDILLPLRRRTLAPAISFRRVENKSPRALAQKLREYAETSLTDRDTFVRFMGAFYDEYVTES